MAGPRAEARGIMHIRDRLQCSSCARSCRSQLNPTNLSIANAQVLQKVPLTATQIDTNLMVSYSHCVMFNVPWVSRKIDHSGFLLATLYAVPDTRRLWADPELA